MTLEQAHLVNVFAGNSHRKSFDQWETILWVGWLGRDRLAKSTLLHISSRMAQRCVQAMAMAIFFS